MRSRTILLAYLSVLILLFANDGKVNRSPRLLCQLFPPMAVQFEAAGGWQSFLQQISKIDFYFGIWQEGEAPAFKSHDNARAVTHVSEVWNLRSPMFPMTWFLINDGSKMSCVGSAISESLLHRMLLFFSERLQAHFLVLCKPGISLPAQTMGAWPLILFRAEQIYRLFAERKERIWDMFWWKRCNPRNMLIILFAGHDTTGMRLVMMQENWGNRNALELGRTATPPTWVSFSKLVEPFRIDRSHYDMADVRAGSTSPNPAEGPGALISMCHSLCLEHAFDG